MDVPLWLWFAIIAGFGILIGVDLAAHDRSHPPTMRSAAIAVAAYASLAVAFGFGVLLTSGGEQAGAFLGGYLTEYSLSVDNLFVFAIIMTRFAVPREVQHYVLLIGIVLALILRGAFIAAGSAVIGHFEAVFYLFGALLLYTAVQLVRHRDNKGDFKENRVLRWTRRVVPTTRDYQGTRITAVVDGRRLATPLLVVMVAIGTTDVMFALDSIPAIFGLTTEPYLVFTANAFALLGLRQLYVLLGGLLDRLVYLTPGLAVILAFIGVKLILEAMHGGGVAWAPEVPIWLSLTVIVVTLVVATAASLLKSCRGRRVEKAADERREVEERSSRT
ncbi:MAG: TerC/Alx family metal homeostasis membrane protein [Streptosporangiaceae bacterium]